MTIKKELLVLLPRLSSELVSSLYKSSETFLRDADSIIILIKDTFLALPKIKKQRTEIYNEMYNLGYQTVFLLIITIMFLGIISVLEGAYHVTLVINEVSALPGVLSTMIIREGGSTITALIVICRICPGITSEIALKKETEQLDAYRMMGINITEYLILPKVVATFVTLISLSAIAILTGLISAMFTCYTHLEITGRQFLHSAELFITPNDFIVSLVKVLIYGLLIPIVASHCGLKAGSGATEIGKAATKSIVASGVLIIALDFLITWIVRIFSI